MELFGTGRPVDGPHPRKEPRLTQPLTVAGLADREGVVERTIYKDVDAACEKIAALMFGIDGIKRK